MHRKRSQPLVVALAVILIAGVTLSEPQSALGRGRPVPMPGERFLAEAERDLVLASMTPNERVALGHLLADDAEGLVVSYTRREFQLVVNPDGTEELREVGASASNAVGSLTLTSHETAFGPVHLPNTDLYLSLFIARTRSTSPYEWQMYPYAEWRGKAGIACGSTPDLLGVAWAGGQYVYSTQDYGQYANGSTLNIWNSEGAPSLGSEYSLYECGALSSPMTWGSADVRIRQSTWRNRTADAVAKYSRTSSGGPFDFTFSVGPLSIGTTPTSGQIGVVVWGNYSY
jgi:hypothetical protein